MKYVKLVDNCKKVAVAFDGVVSSLEVLNCQSIQAQVSIVCSKCAYPRTQKYM